MYKQLFRRVKAIIPKISETEIIALKSGGVSIDREIFKGRVNYKSLLSNNNITKITPDEQTFIKSTDKLLKLVGSNNVYHKLDAVAKLSVRIAPKRSKIFTMDREWVRNQYGIKLF